MAKYKFHQDIKVTIWVKQNFEVEAESKDEAVNIAKSFSDKDVTDSDLEITNYEHLYETEECISVEENQGNHTIEIYDDNSNISTLIATNEI